MAHKPTLREIETFEQLRLEFEAIRRRFEAEGRRCESTRGAWPLPQLAHDAFEPDLSVSDANDRGVEPGRANVSAARARP
jgi:hypothetical protein